MKDNLPLIRTLIKRAFSDRILGEPSGILVIILCLQLFLFPLILEATTYYVKTDGSDANAGTSWTLAFQTVQKALSVADSTDQIWVKAGTYYPDEGPTQINNDISSSFNLLNGVSLYGGFDGTENFLIQRNVLVNETTLSGEIQQDNIQTNNAEHVVTSNGVDSTAEINGFTIRDGYVIGSTANDGGAGLRNTLSSPTVAFCKFLDHIASSYGGAVYNDQASPLLSFCLFRMDSANTAGGAIYNLASNPLLQSCMFLGCSSFTNGGAIYSVDSEPTFINCQFSSNTANTGGAVHNRTSHGIWINCTFSGNKSNAGGGAIYNHDSSPEYTNCIIWNNSAIGAIDSTSAVTFNLGTSAPTYRYCLLAGAIDSLGLWDPALGIDSSHNLNADPLFLTPADPAIAPDTSGDLKLQACSPAIEAGLNDANTSIFDLGLMPRVTNANIDLGAFEYQHPVSNTWTGAGDGVSWTDAGNWSSGTEPTLCEDVVIPAGYTVMLNAGEQAFGKTLDLDLTAELTIDLTAELTIRME